MPRWWRGSSSSQADAAIRRQRCTFVVFNAATFSMSFTIVNKTVVVIVIVVAVNTSSTAMHIGADRKEWKETTGQRWASARCTTSTSVAVGGPVAHMQTLDDPMTCCWKKGYGAGLMRRQTSAGCWCCGRRLRCDVCDGGDGRGKSQRGKRRRLIEWFGLDSICAEWFRVKLM